MDLPYEVYFKLLVPLTVEEILNFCQVNWFVQEDFWAEKARFTLGSDKYRLITGPSPVDRYLTLERIVADTTRISTDLFENQVEYVKAIWTPDLLYAIGSDIPQDILERLMEFLHDDYFVDQLQNIITNLGMDVAIPIINQGMVDLPQRLFAWLQTPDFDDNLSGWDEDEINEQRKDIARVLRARYGDR